MGGALSEINVFILVLRPFMAYVTSALSAGQIRIRYAESRIVFISISYSSVQSRIVFVVYCIHIQWVEYEYILNIFGILYHLGLPTILGGAHHCMATQTASKCCLSKPGAHPAQTKPFEVAWALPDPNS